jgi:hypothetical protein
MESKEITVCLTSCGRWDLLEITIKSLVQFWDGPPPKELLIYEDQDLSVEQFNIQFGIVSECLGSTKWAFTIYHGKKGQIPAIDFLYSKVETIYIWHQEDDFPVTKSGFIQRSLSILEEKPMISQVWIRNPDDRNGHPAIGHVQTTSDGVKYQLMKTGYRGVWHGHSWNPGLRRVSDYKKIFPKGMYQSIHWSPSNPLQAEQLVGKHYLRYGFRAATLLEGYCVHIGINRHVK